MLPPPAVTSAAFLSRPAARPTWENPLAKANNPRRPTARTTVSLGLHGGACAPGWNRGSACHSGAGVEPATPGLAVRCSTIELTTFTQRRLARTHVRNAPGEGPKRACPVRRWRRRHRTLLALALDSERRNAGGSRTHLKPLCRRPPCRLAPASRECLTRTPNPREGSGEIATVWFPNPTKPIERDGGSEKRKGPAGTGGICQLRRCGV